MTSSGIEAATLHFAHMMHLCSVGDSPEKKHMSQNGINQKAIKSAYCEVRNVHQRFLCKLKNTLSEDHVCHLASAP
jgi:hypothetical protein